MLVKYPTISLIYMCEGIVCSSELFSYWIKRSIDFVLMFIKHFLYQIVLVPMMLLNCALSTDELLTRLTKHIMIFLVFSTAPMAEWYIFLRLCHLVLLHNV